MNSTLSRLALTLLTVLAAAPAFANQPYQTPMIFTIPAGDTSNCLAFPVPAGQRVVVEFASLVVEAPTTGQVISGVFLYTSLTGQAEAWNVIPVIPIPSSASYQGAQTLKAYADPETNSRLCVSRSPVNTTGIMRIYGSVTGTRDALP